MFFLQLDTLSHFLKMNCSTDLFFNQEQCATAALRAGSGFPLQFVAPLSQRRHTAAAATGASSFPLQSLAPRSEKSAPHFF
jgi:hypothetical protein